MPRNKHRAAQNRKRSADPTSSQYYPGAKKLDPPYMCVIYDSRAQYNEEEAAVLEVFETPIIPSLDEMGDAWRGQMAVLFCYDRIRHKGQELLVNGRLVGTIP